MVGIVGTVTTIMGARLVLPTTSLMSVAMDAIEFGLSAGLLRNFHSIFAYTVLVNSFVIWLGSANSYNIREYVFARMASVYVRVYKRAIGREVFFVLLLLVVSSVLLMLVFIIFLTPTLFLLEFLMQGCQAGHTELDHMAHALAVSMLFSDYKTMSMQMTAFCNSEAIVPRQLWKLALGGIFCVLGQILVLISVAYNKAQAFLEVPQELKDEEAKLLDPKAQKGHSDITSP